jgi:ABC-type lipoprotein export system ATPase subunit
MKIENHFKLLLDKYNLNTLYKKFIFLSILSSLVKESFYWGLVYFSELVKNNTQYINKFSIILITLIGINIPIDRYLNYIKTDFLTQISISNTKFFNDYVINMSKEELLSFDLVKYFNILDDFNFNLRTYINNQKDKYDIPIRIITLIVVALNKKFGLLIGMFCIFFSVIKNLSDHNFIKEKEETKNIIKYDNIIKNYLVNSKNFLINDEFNQEYLFDNLYKLEQTGINIGELNNTLNTKINLSMFVIIIIILLVKIDKLNQFDFFYYFLMIYDFEFVSDKVIEYYKGRIVNSRIQERLDILYSLKIEKPYIIENINYNKIIIDNIYNKEPKINIDKQIIINKKDHILIDGESGSGKTSLLYIFKGIIKPDTLNITPNIKFINSKTYLILQNHKSLFSDNLYNIITNYQKEPNIELINYSLYKAKINNKLGKNVFINVDKLSGGERMRLLIARIIYNVKIKNYDILLFDEIDENLNDKLAIEICNNIREVFNDKIILYVTHNEKVKQLFDIKYKFENSVLKHQ